MKIYITCEDGAGQLIGMCSFPLDEIEEEIYKKSSLPDALDYFKSIYIDSFSKLCRDMTQLESVTAKTFFTD